MSHPTIVVVDDDEDMAALIRNALDSRGYRAVALSSATQCLEYLRSEVADLVVSDIRMPGMSGLDLCRELTARHPDLLVILTSGVLAVDNVVGAIRAGGYDFIAKPITADRLQIAIARAF